MVGFIADSLGALQGEGSWMWVLTRGVKGNGTINWAGLHLLMGLHDDVSLPEPLAKV